MAENKTQAAGASVDEFLAAVEKPAGHHDGLRLLALMREITGKEPEMWGRPSWALGGTTKTRQCWPS